MFLRNLRSLKASLILPYVLLTIGVSLTLSLTYYWSTERNVREYSDQYIREVAARISQAVHFHIHGSGAVLEAAFPSTTHNPANLADDLEGMRKRFWVATSMYSNPNDYVHYGNEAGQNFGLKRLSNEDVELRLKLKAEDRRTYYHYQGIMGTPKEVSRETTVFDPRNRPWYQKARLAKNDTWTSIYIDYSTNDLVITRSRATFGQNDAFTGVVATDVSLRALSRFMQTLDVGEKGRAFLIERNGDLIAAAKMPNLGLSIDGKSMRVNAANVKDPTVRAAYESVAGLVGSSKAIQNQDDAMGYHINTFEADGKAISVAARRIVDDAGLDWLAIVALPHEQILVGAHKQLWTALSIGLLAVMLAIAIGMLIFGRIAHDIVSLSNAVTRIRKGALDVDIKTKRNDEVGDLARNFQAMHTDLFTDRLTGASNRTALTSMLERLTQSPENPPFTLFFIDLNRFKPLNDEYGHDNGDRALVEVRNRLQSQLRSNDFLARLGGDEFVIITPGQHGSEANAALQRRLQKSIELPLESLQGIPENVKVAVGAAIGLACWPHDATSADELLKQADTAMYRDKGQGSR
ncbi:diguanylate cyclase [Alcaligenaceae bacterium]|nr:diguanylate cyclase [Alcaligenaceae bacterium]